MNADGAINGKDIALFVSAALGSSSDPCLSEAADLVFDGTIDNADVDPFIQLLLGSVDPTQFSPPQRAFLLGPVPGLTTAWHPAPASAAAPLGTTVQFKVTGLAASALVAWTGATEIERGATYSIAESVLIQVGPHNVGAVVNAGTACEAGFSSQLDVVDAANITCTVQVSVRPLLVDENSSNETTMSYFFPISKSNAQLTQVGPGQYRTSVARELTFTAQTQPAGFEPLMEWSRDGQVLGIGQTLGDQVINSPGTYMFAVGPVTQPEQVQIDTYSVTITSHTSFQDTIPEGQPVTFTAATDPPGHEADITWLSSTLYGTGSPILGSGASFNVQFDDAWGVQPDGTLFQWLGVRADNAAFNQDLNECICCPKPPDARDLSCPAEGEEGETITTDCATMDATLCAAAGGICVSECPADTQTIRVSQERPPGGPQAHPPCRHCIFKFPVCIPPGPVPPCDEGPAKVDEWVTAGTGNCLDFDSCPIPADFFAPGSDSFGAVVCCRGGGPLGPVDLPGFPPGLVFGNADTLLLRSADPFDRCDIPPVFPSDPVTVDIEIVALSLVSVEPITVTFNGGLDPELWDVRVEVDPVTGPSQPIGSLTATKTHCNGGTFDSEFTVCPRLIFTRVADGEVRVIDDGCQACGPTHFQLAGTMPWVHDLTEGLGTDNPVCTDLKAGVEEVVPVTDGDCQPNGVRDKCDIEDGTSLDMNGNGIPDECEP